MAKRRVTEPPPPKQYTMFSWCKMEQHRDCYAVASTVDCICECHGTIEVADKSDNNLRP